MTIESPHYVLFKDGEQASKAHSTWDAAAVEAYENGSATWWVQGKAYLAPGYEIRRVK